MAWFSGFKNFKKKYFNIKRKKRRNYKLEHEIDKDKNNTHKKYYDKLKVKMEFCFRKYFEKSKKNFVICSIYFIKYFRYLEIYYKQNRKIVFISGIYFCVLLILTNLFFGSKNHYSSVERIIKTDYILAPYNQSFVMQVLNVFDDLDSSQFITKQPISFKDKFFIDKIALRFEQLQYSFRDILHIEQAVNLENKLNNPNETNIAKHTEASKDNITQNGVESSVKTVSENRRTFSTTIYAQNTLKNILTRNGLDIKTSEAILALKNASVLRDLSKHVGEKIILELFLDEKGNKQLRSLTFTLSNTDTLIVNRNLITGFLQAHIDHIEPIIKAQTISFTLTSSLYNSAKKNGLSNNVISQLMQMFGDTTIARSLRSGDKVDLIYKDFFIKNDKIKTEVVLVRYVHLNKTNVIIAFTDPQGIKGYYDSTGKSLKSPFMRYPLKFKRIGSPFSYRRYHPILHEYYEHTGVDLVADTGTPIKATSDGSVIAVGNAGDGYGNKVVVRRGKYTTLYAHMSRFATDLHRGNIVKQGEIIGYVGMTGRATGPHLHYEFRINNVPYDPMKVEFPNGDMIEKSYQKSFFMQRDKLLEQLKT